MGDTPDSVKSQAAPEAATTPLPVAVEPAEGSIGTVKDVMTSQVIAIKTDETLDVIAELFDKYDYDGMPVVDANYKLIGVITAYDMILQSSGVHLPTVIGILNNIASGKGDRKELDEQFAKLKNIKATAIMNPKALSVRASAPLSQAANTFAQNPRVNPLSVVDETGKLLGVISRYDVLKFFNEKFFNHVVEKINPGRDPFKARPTDSGTDVAKTLKDVQKQFLLVNRRRPLIWKYIAIGAFMAGLVGATVFIIRITGRA